MSQWQRVFTSTLQTRAEMVKGVLETHGLQPVIINKQSSAYHVFGHFEIQVPVDDVLRAIKIIEDEISFGESQ